MNTETSIKEIAACGTETVETERLVLRRFSFEDADSMIRNWVADDEVQFNYGEPSYKTKDEVNALLQKYIGGYESGYFFRWAIIEKQWASASGRLHISWLMSKIISAKSNIALVQAFKSAAMPQKQQKLSSISVLIRLSLTKCRFACALQMRLQKR